MAHTRRDGDAAASRAAADLSENELTEPVRRLPWRGQAQAWEDLVTREWLVTNGMGGYACGTVSGVPTRRFHGLLVAALPTPHGRTMMLNHLWEEIVLSGGRTATISGQEHQDDASAADVSRHLLEFRLEWGLPVWVYEFEGVRLERRVLMPHRQNAVHVGYRLLDGAQRLRLRLRPAVHFRPHEAPVSAERGEPYTFTMVGDRYHITGPPDLPALRLQAHAADSSFVCRPHRVDNVLFRIETTRGYEDRGELWSPGYFKLEVAAGSEAWLVASTDSWETVRALPPAEMARVEHERRRWLVARSLAPDDATAADLVLAADQFIIAPTGRREDVTRSRALGEEARTVIAGYHWFTDWGRDTMISLEGLTLATGRHAEARWILHTFAHHVRDGLIPNMFPEGENEGLYHTADATLWFFHAIERYVRATSDRELLLTLLPVLSSIVEHHLRGTRFGIGVDPADGLLRQGAEGYQLTWMDAKVGDWVVTPRRGKAVEINALWYNALRLMEQWLAEAGRAGESAAMGRHAERVHASFNRRFWYESGGYLYDVVDGEAGDDPACRPNQVFAISLTHAVLGRARWEPVMDVVTQRLLTPLGLRSLAPGHPDYKEKYYGDLRARDAAYHQGTVWSWLIGPFVDAWLKLHPQERARARGFLEGLLPHLDEACVGQISEIFDAEEPFTPRGCAAQAWGVAEMLRAWIRTSVGA
jgi:predicted glycogen debranching enzyme